MIKQIQSYGVRRKHARSDERRLQTPLLISMRFLEMNRLIGVISVSLIFTLTACGMLSSKPPVLTTNLPPVGLLHDSKGPSTENFLTSKPSNLDLLIYTIRVKGALEECNADKGALRLWRESIKNTKKAN